MRFSVQGIFVGAVIGMSIIKSVAFYSITYFFSTLISIQTISKLTIRTLISQEKANEQREFTGTHKRFAVMKPKGRTATLWITIAAAILYFIQISNITELAFISTISITIGILLYGSYAVSIRLLLNLKNKKCNWFYKNNRLFIWGQLFSKINTLIKMSVITSACLLFAGISFITGYFFVNYPGVLLGSREHNQKLLILNRMGMSCKNINKILLKQVILNFSIPVIMAIILLVFSAFKLNSQISGRLGMQNGVILGLGYFLAIFLILMSCYIFLHIEHCVTRPVTIQPWLISKKYCKLFDFMVHINR